MEHGDEQREKVEQIIASFGPCGRFIIVNSFQTTLLTCSCREIQNALFGRQLEKKTLHTLNDGNGMYHLLMKSFRDEFRLICNNSNILEQQNRILVLRGLEYIMRSCEQDLYSLLADNGMLIDDTKDERFYQMIYSYLSTHLSQSVTKHFTELFINLIESTCSNLKHSIEQLHQTKNHRICGISGAPTIKSQILNGTVISHCEFARNSLKEARNCKILFHNNLRRDTDLIGATVVCTTENFFDVIPNKMIAKVEESDMAFLLCLFKVNMGGTAEINLAQQISAGQYNHLLIIPEHMNFQTLVLRAPTMQLSSQYVYLLKALLQMFASHENIIAIDGGGASELYFADYFHKLSNMDKIPNIAKIISDGVKLVSKLLFSSYEAVVLSLIDQITEKPRPIQILHQLKQKTLENINELNRSIISIPQACKKKAEHIQDNLWLVVLGREWGVLDHVQSKLSLFQYFCIDLITEFRIDRSNGPLSKKRSKQVNIC